MYICMNEDIFSEELATYQKEKPRLLSEASNKYVLIKGAEIVGVYASQEDALREGYRRFGNTEFLVKQIIDLEQFNNFTRPIV